MGSSNLKNRITLGRLCGLVNKSQPCEAGALTNINNNAQIITIASLFTQFVI